MNGGGSLANGLGSFQSLPPTASRRARPPPVMHILTGEGAEERVPLKLQRQPSKGGLRAIFTRNKVDKSVVTPVEEEKGLGSITGTMAKEGAGKPIPRSLSTKQSSTILAAQPTTPSRPTAKASIMNLRSIQQGKPSPKSTPKSPLQAPPRSSAAWDPPPLFQAYPQAIKHAQLSASTLSADAILRISQHKKSTGLIREDLAQTTEDGVETTKTAKAKSKHRRQISATITSASYTQKIYVLVTSGYLLQYAGDGSFDRLPEKMMQLGKDSVAFASDVIPGKHWVLQISQAMNGDGTATTDSRSLFSRLAFRGADYRRTSATSILLILDSAEEMDSWIAAVRREIEALGGKKHESETGKPKPDNKVMQLTAQPSERYLVTRSPELSSPTETTRAPSWGREESREKVEEAELHATRPQSSGRPLTGHGSLSNSMTSHEGQQLDNLRDSTVRLSYMSSGQRTLITSQGSTPSTSPTRESTSTFDDVPPKLSSEELPQRANASAITERRRSMHTMQVPVLEPQPKPFRPHSTFGLPTKTTRSISPAMTPNFSVPFTAQKRFSVHKSVNAEVPPPIPIPKITTTTPSKSTMKGTRRSPPGTLTMPGNLSPVKDSPSKSAQSPPVFTPTESAFRRLSQVKASVVDIPPRSPRSSPQPSRRASMMPLGTKNAAPLDFQFPHRYSSMHDLRAAMKELPSEPPRSWPLPSGALETPLPPSPLYPPEGFRFNDVALANKEHVANCLDRTAGPRMRRPASMQLPLNPPRPSSSRSKKSPRMHRKRPSSAAASNDSRDGGLISTVPRGISPSPQGLHLPENIKSLDNRRSTIALANSLPPPAPPPDCALPPLPPASGAKTAARLSQAMQVT